MTDDVSALDQLLSIASDAVDDGAVAGAPAALTPLLEKRNGFYAFESALHVLGARELASWNEPSTWKHAYEDRAPAGCAFAEDLFGHQFIVDDAGAVCSFDLETAELEKLADSIEGWCARILDDADFLTGAPLAHAWQVKHGPLPRGKRLMPATPFICGGAFDVANLGAIPTLESVLVRAEFWRQVRDLPEGAQVRIVVVD